MSLFKKAFSGILNTKNKISKTFSKISFNNSLSSNDIDSIEECLLESDVSWSLTEKIITGIQTDSKKFQDWQSLLKYSIKNSILTEEKKDLKKIILCDLQNEIYPEIEKTFLNVLHGSGYPELNFQKKVDFEELYKKNQN